MIVAMAQNASLRQIGEILRHLDESGLRYQVSRKERCVIALLDVKSPALAVRLKEFPGVGEIIEFTKPYKLASRDFHPEDTIVRVRSCEVGNPQRPAIIAGPCSVESREQILEIAEFVKKTGAHMLRGGAFKPRSSPYSFQGLGAKGLEFLAEARDRTGLPIVTEVLAPEEVKVVEEHADVLQIGARNMQNFPLLKAVGSAGKPVLLKRGLSATVEELLLSAEYILAAGNSRVILCERGIRTFETSTRNTLDIAAIPVLQELSHLPVIVDPSHAAGRRRLVPPLCRAALAAGAHGIIVEVHNDPDQARSDGAQSLDFNGFEKLMQNLLSYKAPEASGQEVTS